MSNSVPPQRWQPTRLPHPWDSPGKNTGVGCHFLLQCKKVKRESEVFQSCPTLSDPMDCSLPGSSIHEIFQARVLEWGAIAFSAVPRWVTKIPQAVWQWPKTSAANREQVIRDVRRPQLSAHLAEPCPGVSMHTCPGTCLGKMGAVGHHTHPLAERLKASNPLIMTVV